MIRPLLVALVVAPAAGCAMSAGGGYTNRLPFEGDGGVALRFMMTGQEPLEGKGAAPAMLVDADFGSFGFREAAYLGAAHGWGDLPIGFVRGGVSLLSIGHEESDPDPDIWVGVSATVQGGMWIPVSDDGRFEIGLSFVAETGWTGAGAGIYGAVWIGYGALIDFDLDLVTR